MVMKDGKEEQNQAMVGMVSQYMCMTQKLVLDTETSIS